jgi:hypothetical protein
MIVIKAKVLAETPSPEDVFQEPALIVAPDGGGYRLTRLNFGPAASVTITVGDVAPWGREVYYWSVYGDGFIKASNYEDSRDYDAFMRSRFGCSEGPVFVAARGGADELAVVTFVPTFTELPYTVHGYGPAIGAVELVIPGYLNSQRAKANKAKRDLLEKVNPVAMLSEMEKQIDLLSALVVDLAEKQPEAERPAWLPQFKAVLAQNSAVQFKGPDAALADIAERKQNMRDLQRLYFEERGY